MTDMESTALDKSTNVLIMFFYIFSLKVVLCMKQRAIFFARFDWNTTIELLDLLRTLKQYK